MAKLKGLLELMDEALNMDAAYEGVRRLGLPENNTAADRAKAMGFGDETYYHGTDADFTGFKVDPSVNYSHAHISSTPDPKIADHFSKLAGKYQEGSAIYPLRTRGNHFSLKDKEAVREVTDMIETQIGFEYSDEAVESVLRDLRSGNAYWKTMEHPMVRKALQFTGYDSFDTAEGVSKVINKANFNPSDVRSPLAHFNPKKAGIGAGSIMSADLLAAPSGQPEFREAPKNLLDKILGYGADSYEYAANEGGLLGDILYGGGARALRNLEKGTTPMVKTGRLPAVPTGDALLDLMSLLQI